MSASLPFNSVVSISQLNGGGIPHRKHLLIIKIRYMSFSSFAVLLLTAPISSLKSTLVFEALLPHGTSETLFDRTAIKRSLRKQDNQMFEMNQGRSTVAYTL